jgi:hypothetical protein
MSKQTSMLRLAISAVLALSGAALTSTALAAADGMEQCAAPLQRDRHPSAGWSGMGVKA